MFDQFGRPIRTMGIMRSLLLPLLVLIVLAPADAVAQKPPRPTLKAANAHANVRRWEDALDVVARLPKRLAGRSEVQRLRIRCWRELGAVDKVAHTGEEWLAKNPNDSEMHVWVGEALLDLAAMKEGRGMRAGAQRDRALEHAQAALRADPMDDSAFELEVATLINLHLMADARKLAKERIKKRPDHVRFQIVYARVLDWTGATSDAIGVLNQAEARLKRDARLPLERAMYHNKLHQRHAGLGALADAVKRPQLTDESARTAGELIWLLAGRYKEWKEADDIVNAWVGAHPTQGLGHWWRGYLHELRKQEQEAIKHYRAAWKMSGETLAEAAYHLGFLLGKQGKEKEALLLVVRGMALNTPVRKGVVAPVDALITLGGIYARKRNWKRATEILSAGAPYATRNATLQQNLGFCYREFGSEAWLKKKSLSARRHWRKGAYHYELAAGAIVDSAAAATTKAQILNDTGLMYHYHLKKLKVAVKWYEQALEHDSAYVDALENMGVVRLQQKKWKDAIGWFDKVLVKVPKRASSLKNKALCEQMLARKK